MSGRLIRIVAPHFVAGLVTDGSQCAPIISYMRRWSLGDIIRYCKKKRWEYQFLK